MNEYQKAKINAGINMGVLTPISAAGAALGARAAIEDFRGDRLLRQPWVNAAVTGLNAGNAIYNARRGAKDLGRLKKIKAIAKAKGISYNDVTKEDIENYNEMVKKAYEDIAGDFSKEATTVRELQKPYKYDNGFKRSVFYNGPKGFRGKTTSYISPEIYDDGSLGYSISTHGKSRTLDFSMNAHGAYSDLVRHSKTNDEERQEYDNRMNSYIKEFGDAQKKSFAPIRKYKAKKALLGALTDAERDYLMREKKNIAERISHDPYGSAQIVRERDEGKRFLLDKLLCSTLK